MRKSLNVSFKQKGNKNKQYFSCLDFMKRQSLFQVAHRLGIMIVMMAFFSYYAQAQVTLSLTYTEKNGLTSIPAGDFYTMQLNYSVSSTTGNATGVKIEIPMPDYVFNVNNFVGTTHAPIGNFVFNNTAGAKKLTINFISPLASGSNGVLEFRIITWNLTTPNNTLLTTTATMTATGGFSTAPQTHNMTLTAIPRICAEKTLLGGGALDNTTTYRIRVYPGSYSNSVPTGTLQATNITLTDNLPAGAQFLSAPIYDISGNLIGNATESGGIVTANLPDLSYYVYDYTGTWQSQTYYVDISVKYNSPTFSINDVVTNTATIAYTPYSGTATTLINGQTVGTCTSDLIETTTLVAPIISANTSNYGCGNVYPGNTFNYQWSFSNAGNVPLDNVTIIDSIPANIRLDQSNAYRGVRFDALSYLNHVEYQTNLTGTTWVSHTYTNSFDLVPILPIGEYFTKIKFVLNSPFPANTYLPGYQVLTFLPAYEPISPETVNNCFVWNSTTAGIPNLATRTNCFNCYVLYPRPATSKMLYQVSNSPSCNALLSIGQNITFVGTVTADAGYSDAQDPVVAMLIPNGYLFVSQLFNAGTSGILTAPTLQIIPNYIVVGGVSKDLYRWTFPSGAGTILPYSKNFSVSATVQVTAGLSSSGTYITDFIATSANTTAYQPENIWAGSITDTGDLDLDGNVTETFPITTNDYCCYACHISSAASMESRKWVKGELDNDYSRYPDFGFTVQGGEANYKLIVSNTGNIPMKDIKVIDVLPFIGDIGVIDPTPRNTQWRPNLAGPIAAPAGITVYYSTVSNPCRDEVKQPSDPSPFPTGCSTANWSVTPPLDITTVQAVKIDFGTKVLAGGDSLIFNWPMRAPVDAPVNNEIAWNSFAFAATRTDNNNPLIPAEPIKVGIKVQDPDPAIYGDRVWLDIDHDGIQDVGESGVSGVLVDIYRDNGDGIANINIDTKIDFTITDDNGNYLFPNLDPGNYFAHFILPIGYTTSPANIGTNDSLDSDGVTTIVTNLLSTEDDRTWDLGIYTASSCDVEIYNYTVSECVYTAGSSQTTVNVFVAWTNAPVGQTINVNITGVGTQSINPAVLSSPQLVSFQVPSDGLEHTITAAFTGGCSGITSSYSFYSPTPCVTNECSLMITHTKTSLCTKDGGLGYALVDAWVSWNNEPAGKDIIVTTSGVSDTIFVSNGALSPVLVTLQVPANGTIGNIITAAFEGSTCSDTDTYNAPISCAEGTIGNYVWKDTNGNSLQDVTEIGINGVIVELYKETSVGSGSYTLSQTTTTVTNNGNAGYYHFVVTESANYYVHFPISNGSYILTAPSSVAAIDGNSDANITTGNSPIFAIDVVGTGAAKDNMTIDAGYTCPNGCIPITVIKH